MADPTPRAFAAATQSGTSVSLTMPAGAQVGDTVVLIGSGYGTAAGMTPSGGTSGWTQIALAPDTTSPFGGTCRFKVWVRDTKVQPGEPGAQSLGVVQSVNDQCNVGVAIFGDCDPADLVDGTVSYVTSADTSAGTITAGQVTTTVSNAVILRLLMSWGGGPVSGWSVLSGSATEQADTGTWDRFAIYADVQASAGASATPSFSAAGSSGRIQAITLAIKGASSATPVEASISQGLLLTQAASASAQQAYPPLAETLPEVFALRQAHYGPVDDKTAPDGATVISPTSYAELKAAIEGGSENEVFWLTTLVRPTHSDLESAQHTENGVTVDRNYVPRISPRNGQEIHCAPGAGYDGRVELTGWIEDNGVWYVTGQTQRLRRADTPPVDVGNDGFKFPHYAEQVWFDGEWLTQVGSLAELKPGTFFFGYGDPGELTEDMRDESLANRIYIAQDPTGHTVETNLTDGAFRGPNQFDRTFSIHNAIIEGHGNPFQTGAVEGSGVLLKNCRVNHNAGGAAILNNSSFMQGCQFNYNGQAGPGASGGDGALVESEVGFNNQKNGNSLWWAHAVKPTFMDSWLYRKVWCHDNNSSGLCSDISNKNIEWDRCLSENNAGHGIVHEIGYNFSIHNNVAIYNGWGSWTQYWAHRVGIVIVNSQDGEVTQNFAMHNLGGQIHRVQDTRMVDVNNDPELGPWILQNTSVHHNVMGAAEGNQFEQYLSGFDIHPGVADRGDYVTSMGNTSDHNTYLPPPNLENLALFFFPDPTYVADPDNLHLHYTFSQWQSAGFDTNGTIDAWAGDDVFVWARQGLLLTPSVEAAATIVPPTVYAGEDMHILQGQSPNRAGVIVSTGGGTIVPESISWSIAAPPPPGHGLITSQPDPLDVVHTVAGTYTWRFQARNEAGFGTDIFLLHVSAVPAATIEQGLLLTHAVTTSTETSASLAHGVLLSQDVAATVTAEVSASHGLLLTQAVTAEVDTDPYGLVLVEAHQGILLGHEVTVQVEEPSATPVEAALVQGLTLTHDAAVSMTLAASVSQGLLLSQDAAVSMTLEASVSQGLTLSQDAEVSLALEASVLQGLTLTQDAAVSMTLEASVSQGLTLTQGAAALAGDTVAATIAQGLALSQQVATQAEVSAQLAHGLLLTQSVSAGSDPAPAIAQGFLLAQAVQASLLVSAAAAHGIVITQDVRGVNHVDVEASIAQGILIRHRVRVGKRSGGDSLATFGRLLRP